ncbi:IPT/TIG domain-containing protein [uncultured Paludibaculum sp.]|uniref:IPT/TIG domain-containing protein n=1 Tax=uncultured Paludibaculum sp. TaxID=1765020 RepID=UPI002AAAE373|nr:IPT/TIG domain-containing protein [uncultured Paludibaculum sp.]
MRPRSRFLSLILFVCLVGLPVRAATQCALTATPLLVAAEGLTEPIGDIVLSCYGGTPLGLVTGSLQISVSQRISNAVGDDGLLQGITFGIQTPAGYVNVPITVRPLETSILIENFQFNMTAQGTFVARVSGIRAEAGGVTQAFVQFMASEQLPVPSPITTVAASQPSLYATTLAASAAGMGPPIPEHLDFDNMIASRATMSSTRITEGFGAAFSPRTAADATNGMRIMVVLSGVPASARIFAPDAIAGSSAAIPTSSGQFGSTRTGGLYNPLNGHSLLLVRVRDAKEDGSGGFAVWSPSTGPQTLFGVGALDYKGPTPYLVYEVLDSNPTEVESAQIPFWLFLPTDQFVSEGVITQTTSLAPLSTLKGSVAGAPIPRYKATAVEGDCRILQDCGANYFPRMETTLTRTPAEFVAPSGSVAQSNYVLVHNIGGGILEWRVSARYANGADWLSISPASGMNNATVRFDVLPKSLPEGVYEADLIFQNVNPVSGGVEEQLVHVKLTVTAPVPEPPPPAPAPTISNVVSPSKRWGMPFAPGSLVILQGTNLTSTTTVTVQDQPAAIVLVSEGELTVQVPLTVTPGRVQVLAANEASLSAPYGIDIIHVAPDLLFVLNTDGAANGVDLPVDAGKTVQIFLTGIANAIMPIQVMIHDRWREAAPEATTQTGVSVLKVTVPDDLPTMQTETMVCVQYSASVDGTCSFPKAIWLKAMAQ